MCWPDKNAMRVLAKLRDQFACQRLVETGTAEGNGLIMYSSIFESLWGCDTDRGLCELAKKRIARHAPQALVSVHNVSSPDLLKHIKVMGHSLFMLDAHKPGSWPILDELRALAMTNDCCIAIHDFKVPGLGHINYGGQALDLDLVRDGLMRVNPDFHLYTNTQTTAAVLTRDELKSLLGLRYDEHFDQAMDYVWSAPVKTYRGILYATPEALDADKLGLVEVH